MSLVRYESKSHVATITMDRRSAHNALNNELCTELRHAWQRFRDSDDRVAVLASAEDGYYTVGAAGRARPEETRPRSHPQGPAGDGGRGAAPARSDPLQRGSQGGRESVQGKTQARVQGQMRRGVQEMTGTINLAEKLASFDQH